jgi:hypothetical protein
MAEVNAQELGVSKQQPEHRGWIDWLTVCLLAVVAIGTIWTASHQLSVGLRARNTENVWFESDVERVYFNMTDRLSYQYRSKVHPVYSLFAMAVTAPAHRVAHLSLNDSADVFLALTAGAWVVLMFLVARKLGFDLLLSALAAFTGLVSAGGLLFFSVPETYGLASVSLLLCLWITLHVREGHWPKFGETLASASALAITVTNWSLGLLVTFRRRDWKGWLQLSCNALLLITAFWTVQKAIMPTSEYFSISGEERRYVNKIAPGPCLHRTVAFLYHGVIAPRAYETADFDIGDQVGPAWTKGISFQKSWPGSASLWGIGAALLWTLMLAVGFRAILTNRAGDLPKRLSIFLLLQFLLHQLYGVETFMYELDWLPILLIVALYGLKHMGRARWAIAVVFVALLTVNNIQEFGRIASIVSGYQKAHPIAPPENVRDMDVQITIVR